MTHSFEQTIESMVIYLEQVEGTCILIGVTDDTVLREHAVNKLRESLPPEIMLRDFRYDPEHLSLLEGAVEVTASGDGRPAISVTGFEALPRDKRTEAIQLLNLQRNRFGRTGIAVILWVNRATLAEISNWSADFYSWRSATFLIEPPPGWNVLESMRRSYLEALVVHNEFVNLQGLAPIRGGQIVQMRMEDIFIPLRAEPEVKSSGIASFFGPEEPVTARVEDTIEATEDFLVAVGKVERQALNPRSLRRRLADLDLEKIRLFEELISRAAQLEIPELLQERRAVVLGDPGAGKTTLLRYVVYTLAKLQIINGQSEIVNRTPDLAACLLVYIRIGEYAQHLQQNPEATLDAFAPIGCQVRQLPLTDELLKDEMAKGRVLFLLDGLDEIIDTGQRREVARRIEEFALSHPQCRVLATSRIVGYRAAQLGGEFSQFTTSPFEDNEIHRFAQNWYTALGTPESAEELVKAIQASSSIRRLASNPLLLTVIALIHWRGTKLPNHRVTLYRLAAETLVDQWMSQRRVTPEGWDVQGTLQVLLPAIAWHLHHTTSSGLIGQEELHRLIVETLRQHDVRLSENEAHSRASQFRRNVSEFSGIFLERGLDQDGRGIYGFLHLTFEEYFAALRLADKWQREGDRVLKPLLHDPRWTEIILLMAGHFGEFSQYQATRFVRTILEAQSEYENILHRDLLMAAGCLADDVRVDAELRRTILSKLFKVYFDSKSPHALLEDIRKVFARLSGTIVEKDVLKALTERLTVRKTHVRLVAIEALGQMGQAAATPEISSTLLKLLTEPGGNIRQAAARALGQMGQAVATFEVLAALHKLLDDPEEGVGEAAAQALRQIGQIVAIFNLFELLIYLGKITQEAAAQALRQMGQAAAISEIPSALLKLLPKLLTNPDVQGRATWVLGQMGQAAATPEILSTLLKLLTDPYEDVRVAAARTLGQMGQAAATPEILSNLLTCLSDSEGEVRRVAAWALGQMGQTATPEVLSTLLKLLSSSEWGVRAAAAGTLGQMGQAAATPEILSNLLTCLSDSEEGMRVAAAHALGQMGQAAATPEILSNLLTRLSGSEGEVCRAAHTLGQMGQAAATPKVLSTLPKLLTDPNKEVRLAATRALEQMGQAAATPEVLSTLPKLLTDPDWVVCWAATWALGQMGQAAATPEILSTLFKFPTDPNVLMHVAVARALDDLSAHVRPQDRSEAVKLFLPLTRSSDAESRDAGYVGLRNLLAAGPQ